jgi:4'-phosphopantetheinyl transferase EntD
MKKFILISGIAAMVISVTIVFGQTDEGAIVYETKINLHRNIPKEREDMKAMIPEFSNVRFQLLFNRDESLFKQLIDEEECREKFI